MMHAVCVLTLLLSAGNSGEVYDDASAAAAEDVQTQSVPVPVPAVDSVSRSKIWNLTTKLREAEARNAVLAEQNGKWDAQLAAERDLATKLSNDKVELAYVLGAKNKEVVNLREALEGKERAKADLLAQARSLRRTVYVAIAGFVILLVLAFWNRRSGMPIDDARTGRAREYGVADPEKYVPRSVFESTKAELECVHAENDGLIFENSRLEMDNSALSGKLKDALAKLELLGEPMPDESNPPGDDRTPKVLPHAGPVEINLEPTPAPVDVVPPPGGDDPKN
jgi:hypothetical protein